MSYFVPDFELKHIGINAENEFEAVTIAELFCSVFNLRYKQGNSSVFADKYIEVVKKNGLGTHGHIAFATLSVEDAVKYLESRGIQINHATSKFAEDGTLNAVYLVSEIGGFAVHLMRK